VVLTEFALTFSSSGRATAGFARLRTPLSNRVGHRFEHDAGFSSYFWHLGRWQIRLRG